MLEGACNIVEGAQLLSKQKEDFPSVKKGGLN
jgi:hypothetical protein